jgi:hypothetical protein
MCVLTLFKVRIYMCHHALRQRVTWLFKVRVFMCPHTPIYVSESTHIYICPHTTTYVSSCARNESRRSSRTSSVIYIYVYISSY